MGCHGHWLVEIVVHGCALFGMLPEITAWIRMSAGWIGNIR